MFEVPIHDASFTCGLNQWRTNPSNKKRIQSSIRVLTSRWRISGILCLRKTWLGLEGKGELPTCSFTPSFRMCLQEGLGLWSWADAVVVTACLAHISGRNPQISKPFSKRPAPPDLQHTYLLKGSKTNSMGSCEQGPARDRVRSPVHMESFLCPNSLSTQLFPTCDGEIREEPGEKGRSFLLILSEKAEYPS